MADSTRQRILIVDDEEAILESLELTLGLEYRVFTATSAEAGLEILDREDIALVISDQVMPGMSGRDLAQQLVSLRPDMKVLYTSAYTDDLGVTEGLSPSQADFLPKPFTAGALAGRVRRLLDG